VGDNTKVAVMNESVHANLREQERRLAAQVLHQLPPDLSAIKRVLADVLELAEWTHKKNDNDPVLTIVSK
jgi:hypothetical protein